VLQPAVRDVLGHVVLTNKAVWAHYILEGQRWSFLDDSARAALLERVAARWASLAGRAIKLRVLSRPYPAGEWATNLDAATPNRLPDVPDALPFARWLDGQRERVTRSRLDERQVLLGVRVGARQKMSAGAFAAALAGDATSAAMPIVREVALVGELVAGAGFEATPADPVTMERLLHSAAAVGVPTPVLTAGIGGDHWTPGDLAAVLGSVRWSFRPWGRTVAVEAWRDGRPVTAHVAVLTVGRMEDQRYPESGRAPWMTYADRLEFPSEWCMSGRIVGRGDYEKEADYHRNRVLHIARHYRHDHGEEPPLSVDRAVRHANEIVDEVTDGPPELAARFTGVIRLAVWGDTEDETLSRARRMVEQYADEVRIALEHPAGQAAMLREWFPAEPWDTTGFQRVMPVGYLAAGLPHTSAAIGDSTGPYLGYACGTTRFAFMLDPCAVTEGPNGRSGLCPIVADPGAGKSFLTGLLAYHGARRGTQTVVLDPSGPLAALCQLPELAPYARHLSLSSGAPGTLSPCSLIADVDPDDYPDWDDYMADWRVVTQARREVLIETLAGLVPYGSREPAARWLPRVVRGLEVTADTTPWEVIAGLAATGNSEAVELGDQLRDVAALREGALVLGVEGEPPPEPMTDAALTVITIEGVTLPGEDTDPKDWSLRERIAQPVLALAIMYASRFVYTGPADRRRQLHLDEVHFLARWASGRSFFQRLARDSRKRNTAVFASSQVPADVLSLGVGALFAHAFVGRLEDDVTSKEALRLVRTPDVYASTITGLGRRYPGEFLYLDPAGRVQRIRVDADWLPHVKEALRTDPGRGE
jgi:hypothetical protein